MPMFKPESGKSFADVPLKVPLMKPRVEVFEVTKIEVQPSSDKQSTNLVAMLKVREGPDAGRVQTYRMNTKLPTPDVAEVRLNRFFVACGLKPTDGGYNTDECIGKLVRAHLIVRSYTDKQTNTENEVNDIKDVWLPGEPEPKMADTTAPSSVGSPSIPTQPAAPGTIGPGIPTAPGVVPTA